MEITINGATYQLRKMTPFQQFHVARRLAPALWALGTAAADAIGTTKSPVAAVIDAAPEEAPAAAPLGGMLAAFGPVAEAFAKMSNEDTEYILSTCLSVCFRKQGSGWASVSPSGAGGMMAFDDINLPVMMQLATEVIKENLGNFFDALPAS